MNIPLRIAELRVTPDADDSAEEQGNDRTAESLRFGAAVINKEAAALASLANALDGAFVRAVELLCACRGSVIVSGMGKAGLIAQKISATLASTGTRSHFLHPAEAIHGDLGRVHADDVVVLLSHSGRTAEILQLLPPLDAIGVPMIAITGRTDSPLATASTEALWIGSVEEAGSLGLAPSTSTTAMLAMGDALALTASRQRGFTREDFARFHPGGALGQKLSRVEDWMRSIAQCRMATDDRTVREILVSEGRTGRRTGAILLTDRTGGQLTGLFTDSDLARLLEAQRDQALDRPMFEVMTRSPTTVAAGTMVDAAVTILQTLRISELPVIDAASKPVGMIDITDMLALLPEKAQSRAVPIGTSVGMSADAGGGKAGSDGRAACRPASDAADASAVDKRSMLRMPNSTPGASVDET